MSAPAKKKRRKLKNGSKLAVRMFKKGISTSLWSESDAVCCFNMNKRCDSVIRGSPEDTMPLVEWYVNDEREVLSREV